MAIDVALLGTGGMMPLPHRWLASTLLRIGGHLLLFDCGEGTQITLRSLGWGLHDIDLILISHLHGDHLAGLPGLLLAQGNGGRSRPVDVVGPPGLCDAVARLRVVAPYLPFELRCRELAGNQEAQPLTLGPATITFSEALHSVPCLAYRVLLPRAPRFQPDRARALGLPVELWSVLQQGQPVTWNGRETMPAEVLGPPRRGLSVGLVTDTRPTADIARLVRDADLLVCEGTYGDDADQPKAVERRHMTFSEAAALARDAGAHQLLLTHFSPALTDPPAYASAAQAVLPNTVVGYDHYTATLSFPDE